MGILLGCIADDFTGASDLASTLVRHGMRTVQTIGLPVLAPERADADAIVVALKSRTIPAGQAVSESLAALRWLRAAGARQILFKYCSTFDSTEKGNIGPVTEALLEALGSDFTIACPAFPKNGRVVFKGYLFVNDVLLSESGMEKHPLTPMIDPNLARVLQRQSTSKVGLISLDQVRRGPSAVATMFTELRQQQIRIAIVDAVEEQDLLNIGEACKDLPLVTGGSGIAMGLPENFRMAGLLESSSLSGALPAVEGKTAIVSGSCSLATQQQVEFAMGHCPAFQIDPFALDSGDGILKAALAWAEPRLSELPVLIYATADPATVKKVQHALGAARAGRMIEGALALITEGLVEAGVRKLVVAGGETAGAVLHRLGVEGLRIGPEIDPGVPWTLSLGNPPIAFALKSGNFGTPDFFLKAFGKLP